MNRPTLTVAGQASEVVASDGSVVLNVPIALRQRSGRRVVAVGGSRCESGERTRTGATPLQLALARGHRWLRMIETGEVSSLREIARRDGADHSYVAKHLNLTLLAPDIVAAILEDALPDGVRLSALLINPPVLWEDQRAALGTTPAPPRVRKAAGSRAGAKGGFYGKTAAQGYATLRSRMRASLDAGCSGTPSLAVEPVVDTAPTYEDLIARLDALPSSLEAVARYDAAVARAEQARALPNPSIAYDRENVYGTGPYNGVGNAETTLTINQPLELFGQRSARIQAARSDANTAGLRREQARWQVAAQLALAYAEAEAAARRHDLAAEALSLTEQDARGVAAMVEQGREATLRGIQAQSEVESAKAARDEASALRDGAFARLSAIAMLERPVQAIGASLLDRAPGQPAAGQDDPLAVQVAEAELDTASRLVTVEQRRARPDVTAAVGMRRYRETDDEAFTVGIELTVPLFDRNRGGIRAAYAEQRAAEARLIAQKQAVQAERLGAEAALAASNSRTRAADSGVAAAEEAYRLSRIGFEAGRISQLELRSTRTALIASRNAAVDARIARVLAEIDLARLEGRAPFGESK